MTDRDYADKEWLREPLRIPERLLGFLAVVLLVYAAIEAASRGILP